MEKDREFVMATGLTLIISGLCTLASLYLACLAASSGGDGVFLFSGFGLLFGIIFVIFAIKIAAGKSAFFKRMDEKISGKPRPAAFVPHRFLMLAFIIAGMVIAAAIFIPLLFR